MVIKRKVIRPQKPSRSRHVSAERLELYTILIATAKDGGSIELSKADAAKHVSASRDYLRIRGFLVRAVAEGGAVTVWAEPKTT